MTTGFEGTTNYCGALLNTPGKSASSRETATVWLRRILTVWRRHNLFAFPLSRRKQSVQEIRREERCRERVRIRHELHDTLFQGLCSALLLLRRATQENAEEDSAGKMVCLALHMLDRAMDEGRRALRNDFSATLGHVALEEAFAALCLGNEFLTDSPARFRVVVIGKSVPIPLEIQEQIYLVGREAVVNASLHSGASEIRVEVEYGRTQLRVWIYDNGCGMDSKSIECQPGSHLGIPGMRRRAKGIGADLRIRSKLLAGTEVEVCVAIK
jgi:signal transduction histidine kinase